MGPPRTRAHLLAQRGRFQEGSMNDRASAVPPLQFLDPSARAALERPLHLEAQDAEFPAQCQSGMPVFTGVSSGVEEKRSSRMNIFGQMWEGMRGRLRIRKDEDKNKSTLQGSKPRDEGPRSRQKAKSGLYDDQQRPSRDEVFANYHQLVASGFFSSHAIQSTRHGPPRPSTSHGSEGPPPQWPLTPFPTQNKMPASPATPSQRGPSQVCSPVSAASSRGTKRAAAESPVVSEAGQDDEGEDDSTLAHRFLPKRLRKTAARDISLPKLRSVASRKNMRSAVAAARRSLSTGAHYDGSETQEREPNKLIKNVALSHPHVRVQMPQTRASVDHVRNPSQGYDQGPIGRKIKRPTSARNLKTRAVVSGENVEAEPLCVVPDANRGIPRVPIIPAKFTYGEDRENGRPWRGLRR